MRLRTVATLLAALVLAGCAAGGASFSQAAPPPEGKSKIVFYRPAGFVGGGATFMIVDNGTNVQRIQNGQFIEYIADPGMHKLNTDTMAIDKPIEVEAAAGQTYYVRASLRQGAWTSTISLSRVYPDEALAELKDCCKSGK